MKKHVKYRENLVKNEKKAGTGEKSKEDNPKLYVLVLAQLRVAVVVCEAFSPSYWAFFFQLDPAIAE
jgi:hypothetical protein